MRARALGGLLALACAAALAGGAGAEGAPGLRPEARPLPEAPLRPLARGEAPPAALAAAPPRPAARPGAGAGAGAGIGIPLRLAVLPPPAQDRGALLAASAPLAVPPGLLEGRVSTMGAPLAHARLVHAERLLDDLFALPLPAVMARAPETPDLPEAPGRPQPRPAAVMAWAAAVQVPVIDTRHAPPGVLAGLSPLAVAQAVLPVQRRADFARVVAAAAPAATVRGNARPLVQGSGLCGVAILSGRTLGHVPGPGACGVEDAVELRAVGGIPVSPAVTVDCRTASAFATWVERVANPQIGGQGGGLARLELAGGYSCRGRNNVAGARLSEHAKGHAIDVTGFVLRDGSRLTVLADWGHRALREMHRGACGIFGTVLGPAANAAHRDHFHFDTARYRAGAYCR